MFTRNPGPNCSSYVPAFENRIFDERFGVLQSMNMTTDERTAFKQNKECTSLSDWDARMKYYARNTARSVYYLS